VVALLVVGEVDVLLVLDAPHAARAPAASNDINVLTRRRAISRGER